MIVHDVAVCLKVDQLLRGICVFCVCLCVCVELALTLGCGFLLMAADGAKPCTCANNLQDNVEREEKHTHTQGFLLSVCAPSPSECLLRSEFLMKKIKKVAPKLAKMRRHREMFNADLGVEENFMCLAMMSKIFDALKDFSQRSLCTRLSSNAREEICLSYSYPSADGPSSRALPFNLLFTFHRLNAVTQANLLAGPP